jgi:hypothetical protein
MDRARREVLLTLERADPLLGPVVIDVGERCGADLGAERVQQTLRVCGDCADVAVAEDRLRNRHS